MSLAGTGGDGGAEGAAAATVPAGAGRSYLFSIAAGNDNLPRDLSTFVGRHREVTGLAEWLQTAPLVTVTGGSGMGKTRVALELARRLAAGYPGGAWFVELASLAAGDDPTRVSELLAKVLDVRPEPGRTSTDAVVTKLRSLAALVRAHRSRPLRPESR